MKIIRIFLLVLILIGLGLIVTKEKWVPKLTEWIVARDKPAVVVHVAENPEGEADPSRMKLGMKTWIWLSALYNDGREVKPKKPGVFTLTFEETGRFSAKTDCNSMSGNYSTTGNSLSFNQIISTKMYCEGSQEADFAKLLEATSGYHFTSRGQMILDLKFDSGSVIFN